MSKQTEALKLARDALEHISSHYMSLPKIGCMALAAVDEAMAEQPAQEPVAWMHPDEYKTYFTTDPSKDLLLNDYWTPLYTSPPASKPWVGLSTSDLDEIDAPLS